MLSWYVAGQRLWRRWTAEAFTTNLRYGDNQMELELGIVESCDGCGCRVRLLGQAGTLSVTYSAAVQDRIRIRQGDLVAVNLAASLPEIVWRWWPAEGLRPLQEAPAASTAPTGLHRSWKNW